MENQGVDLRDSFQDEMVISGKSAKKSRPVKIAKTREQAH